MGILPYKILSCPLHSAVGKTIGVLALFREDLGNPFSIATPDWPQLSGARRSASSRPPTML